MVIKVCYYTIVIFLVLHFTNTYTVYYIFFYFFLEGGLRRISVVQNKFNVAVAPQQNDLRVYCVENKIVYMGYKLLENAIIFYIIHQH